jgi:hypothetical protein
MTLTSDQKRFWQVFVVSEHIGRPQTSIGKLPISDRPAAGTLRLIGHALARQFTIVDTPIKHCHSQDAEIVTASNEILDAGQ